MFYVAVLAGQISIPSVMVNGPTDPGEAVAREERALDWGAAALGPSRAARRWERTERRWLAISSAEADLQVLGDDLWDRSKVVSSAADLAPRVTRELRELGREHPPLRAGPPPEQVAAALSQDGQPDRVLVAALDPVAGALAEQESALEPRRAARRAALEASSGDSAAGLLARAQISLLDDADPEAALTWARQLLERHPDAREAQAARLLEAALLSASPRSQPSSDEEIEALLVGAASGRDRALACEARLELGYRALAARDPARAETWFGVALERAGRRELSARLGLAGAEAVAAGSPDEAPASWAAWASLVDRAVARPGRVADRDAVKDLTLALGTLDALERFFDVAPGHPWERDAFLALADDLSERAMWDDLRDLYRAMQDRWPLDPDAPRLAQLASRFLAMSREGRPVLDEIRPALEPQWTRYGLGSPWAAANADDPEAMSRARLLGRQALVVVATHDQGEADLASDDPDRARALRAEAVDLYRRALTYPPPARDDTPELQLYLGLVLEALGRYEEAIVGYQAVLGSSDRVHQDVAVWQSLKSQLALLNERAGGATALPAEARPESTATGPDGQERVIWQIDDYHRRFLEAAERALSWPYADPGYVRAVSDNAAQISWLIAEVYYSHGHLEEARTRYEAIVQRWPDHPEAGHAADRLAQMGSVP